jgi:hypothetical protein
MQRAAHRFEGQFVHGVLLLQFPAALRNVIAAAACFVVHQLSGQSFLAEALRFVSPNRRWTLPAGC